MIWNRENPSLIFLTAKTASLISICMLADLQEYYLSQWCTPGYFRNAPFCLSQLEGCACVCIIGRLRQVGEYCENITGASLLCPWFPLLDASHPVSSVQTMGNGTYVGFSTIQSAPFLSIFTTDRPEYTVIAVYQQLIP